MQIRKSAAIVLASVLTISISCRLRFAQDGAKQDMKAAGTDTKNAAKDAGTASPPGPRRLTTRPPREQRPLRIKPPAVPRRHTTRRPTARRPPADKTCKEPRQLGKDVGHGTKVAAQDTAHGTEKVGDKIAGKPNPQ